MTRPLFACVAAAQLIVQLAWTSAVAQSTERRPGAASGRWSLSAGAALLHRSSPRSQAVIVGPAGSRVNAAQLAPGLEPGVDLALTRRGRGSWDLGVRYYQTDGWHASRSVGYRGPVVPGGYFATNPPTIFRAGAGDSSWVRGSADLRGTELTLWRRLSERLHLGAGLSRIHLDDHLRIRTLFQRVPASVSSTLSFRTENDLYGLHAAGEALLLHRPHLRLDASAAAGLCGLAAKHSAVHAQDVVEVHARARDTGSAASALGALGLRGAVRLSRCCAVLCSYRLLWLGGIALASEQLDDTASLNAPTGVSVVAATDLDTGGRLLVHGATLALQAEW